MAFSGDEILEIAQAEEAAIAGEYSRVPIVRMIEIAEDCEHSTSLDMYRFRALEVAERALYAGAGEKPHEAHTDESPVEKAEAGG